MVTNGRAGIPLHRQFPAMVKPSRIAYIFVTSPVASTCGGTASSFGASSSLGACSRNKQGLTMNSDCQHKHFFAVGAYLGDEPDFCCIYT